MNKFRVGDVCVIVRAEKTPSCLGLECEIVELLANDHLHDCKVHIPGVVGLLGHDIWWCSFWSLRLKRPKAWDRWIFDTSDIDQEVSA